MVGLYRMKNERKIELLNNMLEYLDNYGIDFKDIGIYDSTKNNEAYDKCLGYIVELVGNDRNDYFFESVLGFAKEELFDEGMGWIYE